MNIQTRIIRQLPTVKPLIAWTIGLGFCSSIALLLQAHFIAKWIHLLFLAHSQLNGAGTISVGLMVAFLVRSACSAMTGFIAARFAANAKLTLRSRWMSHLFTLSPLQMERMQTGELVTTALTGVDKLEAYLGKYLPQAVQAVLVPVLLLAYILRLDWISAVLLVVTAPLIVFFMILLGRGADATARKQWQVLENLSSQFLELVEGLLTLKLFSRFEDAKRILLRIGEANRSATMKTLRIAFLSAFALELFATLGTAAVALALGLRLIHSELSFTSALTVLLLTPEFFQPIRALGTEFHAGLNGLAAAESLFQVLDMPSDEETRTDVCLLFDERGIPDIPDIQLREIAVCYDESEATTLRFKDFTLHAGEKLAIRGPSGCGKTTLLRLLAGELSPTSGQVIVGERRTRTLAQRAWRQQVSFLHQHPYIFAGTISENLRMSVPNGMPVTNEQLRQALTKAGLANWLQSLPDGLDTRIGDGGKMLSDGEAQRVAIARAWLRQAPLLILDEPTAHLDPLTAADIEELLVTLTTDRTVVVVTHDTGLAARMDRTIYLNHPVETIAAGRSIG